MLTKDQVIEGIRQINRTASHDWLNLFDIPALSRYLDHLQRTIEPRGGHSIWIRPTETSAIITREPAM